MLSGIELVGEGSISPAGGRGVRLKERGRPELAAPMFTTLALACVAVLLATSVAATASAGRAWATSLVYGLSLAASLALLALALVALIGGPAADDAVVLPLGLPWIGMHFRIDALSALFLGVVNLGGAGASLYALGYGAPRERRRRACCRSIRRSSPR